MREVFDGYYCQSDYCIKDIAEDETPPCKDCGNCLSFEECAEIYENFIKH